MSFRRSNSGLSNLRLFKMVDLIVFTEGGSGTNFSAADAYSGKFHSSSDDIKFWKFLFDGFLPNVKISYRALGCKSSLQDIAKDIAQSRVTGVCVVIDRDYDEHFSKPIKNNNVIYTRCYSWENELFHAPSIEGVFSDLIGPHGGGASVKNDVRKIIKSILGDLRGLVRADALMCVCGDPLFKRGSEGAFFSTPRKNSAPQIKREWIRSEIKRKRGSIGKYFLYKRGIKFNAAKHCYGKLLLTAARLLLQHLLLKSGYPTLPNVYSDKFLLDKFRDWIFLHTASSLSRYYSLRISRVVI